jgi:hypothetical protein
MALAAILLQTIQKPDKKLAIFLPFENWTGHFSLASVDRFGMNKIFVITLFFKRSRLKSGQKSPDFKWSGFQMAGTGIRSNPNTDHSSVFGGSLYVQKLNVSGIQTVTVYR